MFNLPKHALVCGFVICLTASAAVAQESTLMREIDLTGSKVIDPSQIISEEIGFERGTKFSPRDTPRNLAAPPAPTVSRDTSRTTPAIQTSTPVQRQPRFNGNQQQFGSQLEHQGLERQQLGSQTFGNQQFGNQQQSSGIQQTYDANGFNRTNNIQVQSQGFQRQTTTTPWSAGTNNQPNTQLTGSGPTLKSVSAPSIQTQIIAPRFINVNEQTLLSLKVENVGNVDVSNVRLTAILPAHAKFVNSTPRPTRVNGNEYQFTIDSLNSRRNQFIRMEVVPTAKAPLDIETNVQIASTQRVAVRVRQPVLEMQIKGPARVKTGQTFKNLIRVKNTGDGYANKVLLKTNRPTQIGEAKAPQKVFLERLGPGQEVQFEVVSFAQSTGDAEVAFEVSAKGAESRAKTTRVDVVQPELQVLVAGPDQNFINKDGVYTIKLQNTSQVTINNVSVEVAIPRGLKVNTINRQTANNTAQGTMVWKFQQFPANRSETIQFRAEALSEGQQVCRVNVNANEMPAKEFKIGTMVSSRSDVSISIRDAGQPVGIGSRVDFSIELNNRGGRDASQSEVVVDLPPGLTPVAQKGYSINQSQNQILFQDVSIKANHTTTLRFTCAANQQGDHIVRSTFHTGDSSRGVSAEDSVFIFETRETKVSDALKPELRR